MGIKDRFWVYWRWLERLHTAIWVYGHVENVLGPWSVAFAFLYVVLVGTWGVVTKDWLNVFIGAPIAGFFLLLAWNQWVARRKPEPFPQTQVASDNIDAWSGHPIYYVWVAACLWVGMRPWPSIPADSLAYEPLQRIKSAIEAGQITMVSGTGNMRSRVSRDELIKLAMLGPDRPRFLFRIS